MGDLMSDQRPEDLRKDNKGGGGLHCGTNSRQPMLYRADGPSKISELGEVTIWGFDGWYKCQRPNCFRFLCPSRAYCP